MISIISAIIFSFSANIDNIAVGILYGTKKIHISCIYTLIIALCTSIITSGSMYIGKILLNFLNINIANIIGAVGLILIGIIGIIKYIIDKTKKKYEFNNLNETIKYTSIKSKDLIVIIFTLSLNNFAAGIAASVAGTLIIPTLISTFFFSFIFMYIGNHLGKKLISNILNNYSELISSFILILLGVIEYIF